MNFWHINNFVFVFVFLLINLLLLLLFLTKSLRPRILL